MTRKAVTHLYRGKLAILFLFLAFSNLGVVDESGWMIATEAGCEECENVQEDISFNPGFLELLESESKTATAAFTGGPASWSLSSSGDTWCSVSFASSSSGVSTTTIRAQAASSIPVEFPGRRTWVMTPVTADPVDTLVAETHRYLTIYGLGSSLNAPNSFPIVEGETRTIRVGVLNSPPSSTWQFGAAVESKWSNLIVVEDITKTGNQSAAITLRASAISGCNKPGFCTRYSYIDIWAERESDQRRLETDVWLPIYFRD